jgi:hypothetical protein
MNHTDIRIGTVVHMHTGANYVRQILPHGFEGFQMFAWKRLNDVDLARTGAEVLDAIGDKAVISSLGMFGNPIQPSKTAIWAAPGKASRTTSRMLPPRGT